VSRFWPEVFDVMVDLLTESGSREDFEGGRKGRLAALAQRMRGKRR